jgi:hypothetical protein
MPFGPDRQLPSDFIVTPITSRKPRHKLTGRPLGAKSKFTTDLKSAILEAAANIGDDQGRQGLVAFLEDSARRHRKAYLMLLARLMPLQVDGSVSSTPVSSINILSIPSGCFLTAEQLEQPSSLSALANEHAPPAALPEPPASAPAEIQADDLTNLKQELREANALLGKMLNER